MWDDHVFRSALCCRYDAWTQFYQIGSQKSLRRSRKKQRARPGNSKQTVIGIHCSCTSLVSISSFLRTHGYTEMYQRRDSRSMKLSVHREKVVFARYFRGPSRTTGANIRRLARPLFPFSAGADIVDTAKAGSKKLRPYIFACAWLAFFLILRCHGTSRISVCFSAGSSPRSRSSPMALARRERRHSFDDCMAVYH